MHTLQDVFRLPLVSVYMAIGFETYTITVCLHDNMSLDYTITVCLHDNMSLYCIITVCLHDNVFRLYHYCVFA